MQPLRSRPMLLSPWGGNDRRDRGASAFSMASVPQGTSSRGMRGRGVAGQQATAPAVCGPELWPPLCNPGAITTQRAMLSRMLSNAAKHVMQMQSLPAVQRCQLCSDDGCKSHTLSRQLCCLVHGDHRLVRRMMLVLVLPRRLSVGMQTYIIAEVGQILFQAFLPVTHRWLTKNLAVSCCSNVLASASQTVGVQCGRTSLSNTAFIMSCKLGSPFCSAELCI